MKKLGRKASETTVAIQGFGNAGENMADILSKLGYKIVAASDSKGAIVTNSPLERGAGGVLSGFDIAKLTV